MRRYRFSHLCLFALVLCLLIPVCGPARAFDLASADVTALEERASGLDATVADLAQLDVALESARLDLSPAQITERRERLESLQVLYRRLAAGLVRSEGLEKELQKVQEIKASGGLPLEKEPPYALSLLDKKQERLQGLQQRLDAQGTTKALAQRALDRAKSALSEAQTGRRRLSDEVRDGEVPPSLAWRIRLADLAIDQAQAEIALQERLLANAEISAKSLSIEIELTRQNRDWIAKNIAYSEEDLQTHIEAAEARKATLNGQVEEKLRLREKMEKELLQAQTAAQKAETEDQSLIATTRVRTKADKLAHAQTALELLQGRIELATKAQQIWQARYAIVKGDVPSERLFAYQDEASARSQEFDESLAALQAYQMTLGNDRETLNREMLTSDLLPKVAESLQEREKDLTAAIENNMAAISDILRVSALNSRLVEETKQTVGAVQIAEKVTSMGFQRIVEIWQTELWTSGDHGVTVGKLLVALVLMSMGFLVSRRTSKYVGNKLLTRFEMELGAAQAAKNFSFYLMILLFFLAALRIVNIPLTAFAFLGGAFAIGIGLGAQKFFSDLISGFIILMQKPFRINDMIQVDGMFATVIEVGSRYTKIRTFDNADVMMPNGYLLDNRIINWTLGDQVMRSKVSIGVDYSSDPRQVESLLLRAAKEHLKVLPKPAPFVFFSAFGESTLDFDLYFWVNMDFASGIGTASDLRYAISELFREASIKIAFPQSDVHLKVDAPLHVRLEEARGAVEEEQHGPKSPETPQKVTKTGDNEEATK